MNFFLSDEHPCIKSDYYKLVEPANTVSSDLVLFPKTISNCLQLRKIIFKLGELLITPILPFIYSIPVDRCHSGQQCCGNYELGCSRMRCPISSLPLSELGVLHVSCCPQFCSRLCTPHSKHPLTGLFMLALGTDA